MEITKLDEFNVIGIEVRTSNNNGEGVRDIGNLWHKFISEDILAKIPNKVNNAIYAIYTEYEGDYTKPYTTLIGCKVGHLDEIPDGMHGMKFSQGSYQKFVAQGNLSNNIIANAWQKIWSTDIDRAYTQDFEVYDEKAANPANAQVDIYIAVKD